MSAVNPFPIEDKIIVGAGSGVGWGVALGLLATGGRVFGFDRDEATLEENRALSLDGCLETVVVDVANEKDIVAPIAGVVARAGRGDVVFANAGIACQPPDIDDRSLDEWRPVFLDDYASTPVPSWDQWM